VIKADLKQQIKSDLNKALKERDGIVRSTLGILSAAISDKEKEKRYKISKKESGLDEQDLAEKSALTEEEIVEVIFSEAKKRREAIASFKGGGRIEMAEKEKKELETLRKYLPEQLTEEEIEKIIKEAVKKIGASEMKDMGKVMAEIMPKIKGKADGSTVSRIVKELLSAESKQ